MSTAPKLTVVSDQDNDIQYIAIRKNDLLTNASAPADFFLKLANDKYVQIVKEGSLLQLDQLHSSEKSEWLYVRKGDYQKCVGSTVTVAGVVMNSNTFSPEKKNAILSKAAESVFNSIEHLGFDHQALEHSKMVSRSIQSLVEHQSDLSSVVNMMMQGGSTLSHHSMLVSAISVIIAKEMKWTSAQNLEKLALGALLHDVGLKEIPDEILETPRHALTRDQIALYESHVYRGVDILRTMPSISDDIVSIALEHHENAAGLGYPRHLRDIRMNPFARIVALANCFCDLVAPSVNNPNPKSAEAAVEYIEITMGQPYHKPAFLALKDALSGSKR